MKKIYLSLLLLFAGLCFGLNAQNIVDNPDYTYRQNFNSLPVSGSGFVDFNLDNWEINDDQIKVSDGADNQGAVYSFGSAESSDRALGGIVSSKASPLYWGTSFRNESKNVLTKFTVEYKGEQWRRSDKKDKNTEELLADTLHFEYSLNATSVGDADAIWKSIEGLNFISPITLETPTKLDGNNGLNSRIISEQTDLEVHEGETLFIRWSYTRETGGGDIVGARDGLGIDDLAVSFGEGNASVPCNFDEETTATIISMEKTMTEVDIEFEPVPGASGYIIMLDDVMDDHEFGYVTDGEYYNVGDFIEDTKVVDITTNTKFLYTDLNPGGFYYITVTPFYECEESIFYGFDDFISFFTLETCDIYFFIETKFNKITPHEDKIEFELLPIEDAKGYVVILIDEEELMTNENYEIVFPEDGDQYRIGDPIGDAVIGYIGTSPKGEITGLEAGHPYILVALPFFECDGVISYGYEAIDIAETVVPTFIRNNKRNQNIVLYPNPTSGSVLNIKLSSFESGKAQVSIYNIAGVQVYSSSESVISDMQIMLPGNLQSGRYILSIKNEKEVQIGSFVLVK